MFDDRTSRRVGALVMILVGLAGGAVMLVDCAKLRPGIEVTAYFGHIDQLTEGADIQIAGRVVGQVTNVSLVQAERAPQGHPLHPTGGVALSMRFYRRYTGWTSQNGDLFITSKGLLGEPYLELGPPPPGQPRERPLRDGDVIRGIDPPRLDQVVLKSFANMSAFRALVDEVAPSARELRAAMNRLGQTLRDIEPEPGAYAELGETLSQLADEIGTTADELDQTQLSLSQVGSVVDRAGRLLTRAQDQLEGIQRSLDALLADIDRIRARLPGRLVSQLEVAIGDARSHIAKLERIVGDVRDLTERIRLGHGTVGALLNDPEFIDDAKKLGKILKRQPWRVIGHPRKQTLDKQP